jgi:hypothetical protein
MRTQGRARDSCCAQQAPWGCRLGRARSPVTPPKSGKTPLVVTLENDDLEQRRRRVRKAIESGDLDGLSGEDVMAAWTGSAYPEGEHGAELWVKAFRHAKEWFNLSPGNGPVELFRGTVPQHERGMAWTTDRSWAYHFAWGRLHRHDPASGAERLSVAYVYRTEVDRGAILCEVDENPLLSGRHFEKEVIVDPQQLRAIECIETLHPGAEMTNPT